MAASRGRSAADVARDNNSEKPDSRNVRAAQTQATLADYDTQLENYTIISGTPKTVIPKIRHVLETLRPGTIFFWDGDGAMTHDDSMRSLRLMGSDVIPAVKEMAKELDLPGSFEIDTQTNEPYNSAPAVAEVAGGGA